MVPATSDGANRSSVRPASYYAPPLTPMLDTQDPARAALARDAMRIDDGGDLGLPLPPASAGPEEYHRGTVKVHDSAFDACLRQFDKESRTNMAKFLGTLVEHDYDVKSFGEASLHDLTRLGLPQSDTSSAQLFARGFSCCDDFRMTQSFL